ncbi:hypothetical protein, partial [Klebsiella pneumoniae]|uniref:hypothetical protein n=1 Tax=Klebsiella pneumoniae TaxID=573 RepID=UPI0030132E5C
MGAEEQQQEADQKPRANPTSSLSASVGTLTESQFLSWKRQKDAAASTRKADASRKRDEDIAAGT